MNAAQAARDAGFAQATLVELPRLDTWQKAVIERPSKQTQKLSADAKARSILLLIFPYSQFIDTPNEPTISAYYVASNEARNRAKALADALNAEVCSTLPLKPLISGYGLGEYGMNGVTAMRQYGSHYAVQALLTDAEPEITADEFRQTADISCDCGRCVNACPAHAIDERGRVDANLCLRALANELPFECMPLIGNSIWGCEYCRDACPKNAKLERVAMPEKLRYAIGLERLLDGEVDELAGFIGANYARPARMQARASIVAANLNRRDLKPRIERLTHADFEPLRRCANWALTRL